MPTELGLVFDVEHIDEESRTQVIGSNLTAEEAVELARGEARRRRLGRMFRAGSPHVTNVIVITDRSTDS